MVYIWDGTKGEGRGSTQDRHIIAQCSYSALFRYQFIYRSPCLETKHYENLGHAFLIYRNNLTELVVANRFIGA